MLTLWTAGFFVLLGFLAAVVGYVTGHPDVSLIGWMLILALGIMIMNGGGLQVRTGEQRVTNATANTTTIDYEYEPVVTPDRFPMGFIVILLGSAGSFHSISRFTES